MLRTIQLDAWCYCRLHTFYLWCWDVEAEPVCASFLVAIYFHFCLSESLVLGQESSFVTQPGLQWCAIIALTAVVWTPGLASCPVPTASWVARAKDLCHEPWLIKKKVLYGDEVLHLAQAGFLKWSFALALKSVGIYRHKLMCLRVIFGQFF